MDTFKAFLLGTARPAPTVAITAVTLAPTSQVPANSPAGTVLGTLGATVSGGALVNPVYSLVTSAGGDVKLVGQQVQLNVNNLPAGTYAFRARVVADNAAALEGDLSFTVTTAPQAATGAGEGIDFDFGYGRQATLAVPFRYKAATAMPAGEVVQFAQPTAKMDLPAGWRWYAEDADGNRLDVQQDMEGSFADGSLETSALTITNPAARTAGEVVPLTLKAEQVAPSRAPFMTHAQVRAALANLKMEAMGYDLGADTLVMPAAWVLDNCKEWTAASPGWGPDPVGGWQYLKRGPQCVELLIWGYYRSTDLAASHKWLRVDLLCQRLASGAWDIGVVHSQPNAFNAHPAGTLGAARQARIACVATLKDGATILHTWGGAGDPNANTRPLSAIDRATGRIDFGNAFADDQGGDGAVIGVTGSDLPAGVTSGQVLGHIHWDGVGQVLSVERHTLDAGKVMWGSGGSGNVTFTPLATTWPNGFCALYTPEGTRVRWGGSPRPTVLPMHDRGYLTQRAKTVPAMDLALPDLPHPNQFKPKHILGSSNGFTWALQATSNGAEDDRLGYVTSTQAALLWAPGDEARHRRAVVNSLAFMTFHIAHYDETSGTEVVYSGGPNGDKASTYPGMGAIAVDTWTTYSGYNSIHIGAFNTDPPPSRGPGHFYRAKWKQEQGVPGWSGYQNQYDVLLEGSHAPNHHLVPWLRTADYVHLMALRACACTGYAANSGQATVQGKTHPVLYSGGRTFAWTTSTACTAESALPDGMHGKQMLADLLDHSAKYCSGQRLQTHPGRFLGESLGKGASYMMAYVHIVVAQDHLKGKRNWRRVLENAAIWSVQQYDDEQGPIPNGGYCFGLYGNNADGIDYGRDYFPSLLEYAQVATNERGAMPYPASGFRDGAGALTYTARAEMCALRLLRSCHEMGIASIPRAKRVEELMFARGLALESGYNAATGKVLPQWDMVSLIPPAATAAPGAVTGAAASNVTATTATVAWARPATGGPVFSYRLRLKSGAGAYALLDDVFYGESINLSALPSGVANTLEITSRNPVGLSADAPVEVSFTTPAYVSGPPVTVQAPPGVDIGGSGVENITLTLPNAPGARGRALVFASGLDLDDMALPSGWAGSSSYHDGGNNYARFWSAPFPALVGNGVVASSQGGPKHAMIVETSGVSFQYDVITQGTGPIPMLAKDRADPCRRYVMVYVVAIGGSPSSYTLSAGTLLRVGSSPGDRRMLLIEMADGDTAPLTITPNAGYIDTLKVFRVNAYAN